MTKIKLRREQIAWQSKPAENLVGKEPVKEDINFPTSLEECVRSFSLRRTYLKKQLRKIQQMHMNQITKRRNYLIENVWGWI